GEAIPAAGGLAGAAHADEVGRQTPTDALQRWDDVAPEIRRGRVAVQKDDGRADADLHVGEEAVEDGHTPPLVEVGCRHGSRHGASIIIAAENEARHGSPGTRRASGGSIEERHGFAGALRTLGVWGPCRGPYDR